MGPLRWSTIVITKQIARGSTHTIGVPGARVGGHAVMSPVELHVLDAIVTLDASGLLESLGDVLTDFAEDGDLALQNLLVAAHLHLAGNVVDEAFSGRLVENLLPQGSWGIEILWPDLGQESNGLALEVAMGLVEVDGAFSELDGIDGRQVICSGTLVVECHGTIALEVAELVAAAGGIDGELLVVDTHAMAVGIRV